MSSFVLTKVRDMLAVPPPPMLIETILPRQTVTGLSAQPGCGKTWFALELSRAVVTGTKAFGHFATETGNVVFIGEDASIYDYARQLRKLTHNEFSRYDAEVEAGARGINPFDDRMHFIVNSGLMLENKEHVKSLVLTVRGIQHSETEVDVLDPESGTIVGRESRLLSGTDLIILDTLSALTRAPQNDNTLMEIAFRNIRWLSKMTGAGVILLHHNAKPSEYAPDGDTWRGASSQVAALDNWFNLSRVPRTQVRVDGEVSVKVTCKIKRFRGLTPDDFTFQLRTGEEDAELQFLDETMAAEPTPDVDVEARVRAALEGGEWKAVRDIATETWDDMSGIGLQAHARQVRKFLVDPANYGTIEAGPKNRFRLRPTSEATPTH